MKAEENLRETGEKPARICFFGHFGTQNSGNESSLQVILYYLRRRLPDAKVTCICSEPEATAAAHKIKAIPIKRTVIKPWKIRGPLVNLVRKLFIGIPSELYRWFDAFKELKGTDLFIIPGTGLLTDAFGLSGWGPYGLFKWSAIAKLRGCKVLFVSVGAGPLRSKLGKRLTKMALSLADFRSYRDSVSMDYLKSLGFPTNGDRIYPDLVFSLPDSMIPADNGGKKRKCVVGLGLMEHAGNYGTEATDGQMRRPYLESFVEFAKWLLNHDYDIRLLVGDTGDVLVAEEFKCRLKERVGAYDEKRVVDMPLTSAGQILSQLAATDFVVATRFHNVLLALVLNKPAIAVSFHHKGAALMNDMGLAEYSCDINHMNAGRLIEQFEDLVKNSERLRFVIRQKVGQFRAALDEQYSLIFQTI